MSDKYLANIELITEYKVYLEFTKIQEPATISEKGLPFVSIQTEIDANSLTKKALSLRKQYGCIPYGSPLYIWEVHTPDTNRILYIGQTMLQKVQNRFEGHSNVLKLSTKNVNNPQNQIFYRLCCRFNLTYEENGNHIKIAIEHLPLEQARKVVNDIEAWLIFKYKPEYNTSYVNKERKYWKNFIVEMVVMKN